MSKRTEKESGTELAIQLARVTAEEQRREELINMAMERIADANLNPTAGAWSGRGELVDEVSKDGPCLKAEAEDIVDAAVAHLLAPPSGILRHVEKRKMLFRLESYRQLANQYLTVGETEEKYELELVVDPMTKQPILGADKQKQYKRVPVEIRVKKGLSLGVLNLILQLEDRVAKLVGLDTAESGGGDATADIFKRFERDTDGNVTQTDSLVVRQKLSLEELAAKSPQVAAMLQQANTERAKQVSATVLEPEIGHDEAGEVGPVLGDAPASAPPERVDDKDRRDA